MAKNISQGRSFRAYLVRYFLTVLYMCWMCYMCFTYDLQLFFKDTARCAPVVVLKVPLHDIELWDAILAIELLCNSKIVAKLSKNWISFLNWKLHLQIPAVITNCPTNSSLLKRNCNFCQRWNVFIKPVNRQESHWNVTVFWCVCEASWCYF